MGVRFKWVEGESSGNPYKALGFGALCSSYFQHSLVEKAQARVLTIMLPSMELKMACLAYLLPILFFLIFTIVGILVGWC